MVGVGIYSNTYSDTYAAGGSGGGTVPPRYNPNAPIVAGDEWLGTHPRQLPLSSAQGRCAKIVSTATENISSLIPMTAALTAGVASQSVFVGVDLYDISIVPPLGFAQSQSWAMALPSANGSTGGSGTGVGHGWQLGAALLGANLSPFWTAYDSTAFQRVNDVVAANSPLTAGNADSIVYSPASSAPARIMFHGASTLYDGDTGVQNQTVTGKRIGWVEVVVVVANSLPNGCSIDGVVSDTTGNFYTSDSGPIAVPAGSGLRRLKFGFYWNPANHQDWTTTAAQNFLNGSKTFGIQAAAQPNSSAFSGLVVTAVMIQFRVLVETRVAVGYQSMPIGKNWQEIVLLNPDTRVASPWAKENGNTYLAVFHLTNDGGAANLRAMDCASVADHETDELDGLTTATVDFDIGGAIPTADPIYEVSAMSLLLASGTGSLSQDSQPYAAAQTYPISVDHTVTQLLSGETAGTFGAASVLVQSEPDGQGGILQNAPLEVSLRKTSDDSLLAGPASIELDDVDPDGKLHNILIRFPSSVVLTAAEAVYLSLTSSSTVNWKTVGMLSRDLTRPTTDSESVIAASVGVGSTDDYGTADTVADLTLDFPFSIREVPPILTSLSSAAATIANTPALTGLYRPGTLGLASLVWTPSALTTQFARYELQRLDYLTQSTSVGVWQTIARITDEDSAYFNDIELAANTPVLFRVRVIGNPLGSSDWATFDSVTVAQNTNDFVFASNWDPEKSFGAQDADVGNAPARDYDKFPGTGGLTIKDLHGADYPAAFRQSERGADVFKRRLLIATEDDAVTTGAVPGERALFDALVDLFHDSALPYVMVRDGMSRRWFCAAEITGGSTSDGMTSMADVTFTEIAFRPEPIVTDAPWVP